MSGMFVDPIRRLLSEKFFFCAAPKEVERIWATFEKIVSRPHPQGAMLSQAYAHHYGGNLPGGLPWAVQRRGDEGELAAIRINTASQFVKAKVSLVTASQVSWAVRAKKDSAAADQATALARSLIDDAWERHNLAAADVQWEELTQVMTAGYAFVEWDRTRGPDAVVDASAGMRKWGGDCRLSLLSPLMVATDPNLDSADDQDWWFVCVDRPKSDLVCLYSDLADGRKGEAAAEAIASVKSERALVTPYSDIEELQTMATVVHFIHRPTMALPLGRHVVMLAGDVILRDTPLIGDGGDYEMVPVVRRAAEEQIGSSFAYSRYLDTLAAQEILDAHHTTQSTIITSTGNPILAIQKGSDAQPGDIATFGRPWEYPPDGQPPQWISPVQLAESHLKYGDTLVERQQQLMSLNDAALGQPQTAERNAQAEALFASMAVQQAGPAVLARRRSLSQLGQVWLTTLRKNVSQPRLLQLVGEGQRNLIDDVKMWTGTDLGPIDAVEVEERSPEESTIAGRWAIFENYMQLGVIKTPEDAEQVRATGRLDKVVDPIASQRRLVEAEYEMLSRGEEPLVHPTQNQLVHYPANASVLHSISALQKPKVRNAVMRTLDLRYEMYFGVKPALDPQALERRRFLLGEGPLPPPMAPPGMPPPPMGAPAPGAPPEAAPPMPSPGAGEEMQGAPTNPLNGQPFSPTQPPVARKGKS